MRKRIQLSLSKQEANLIVIWAVKDAKLSYASPACQTFDDRLVDKLTEAFNIKSNRNK